MSEKSIRAQAVASVTQDMSSARLKVLGDLMETRKKAEAHEQEFLRAIHSENAAFSQIVSLFESNLLDIRSELSSETHALEEKLTTVALEVGAFKDNILGGVDSQISKLLETVSLLQTQLDQSKLEQQQVVDSLKQKVNDTLILDDKRSVSLRSEIFDVISSLESRMNIPIVSMDAKISSISTDLASLPSALISQFNLSLIASTESIRNEFELKLKEEEKMNEELNSRLNEFEAKFFTFVKAEIAVASEQIQAQHQLDLKKELTQMEEVNMNRFTEFSAKFSQETDEKFENRNIEISNEISKFSFASPQLDLLGTELKSIATRVESDEVVWATKMEETEAKMSKKLEEVSMNFSGKFDCFSNQLTSISSTGHYYDWIIPTAISRLKSLGILSGSPSYISSESFKMGPFRDLFFRFFPATAVVWLVHKPSANASEALLPLAVDIGIGDSKRGPIRMKKVQELFGHWVWEATFAHLAGSQLSQQLGKGGELKITVEIAMKQWLVPNEEDEVEDDYSLPNSPSAMSNYTFADQKFSDQQKVLNPFGLNDRDLTPRRSSWAQFGEESPKPPNPFS